MTDPLALLADWLRRAIAEADAQATRAAGVHDWLEHGFQRRLGKWLRKERAALEQLGVPGEPADGGPGPEAGRG